MAYGYFFFEMSFKCFFFRHQFRNIGLPALGLTLALVHVKNIIILLTHSRACRFNTLRIIGVNREVHYM